MRHSANHVYRPSYPGQKTMTVRILATAVKDWLRGTPISRDDQSGRDIMAGLYLLSRSFGFYTFTTRNSDVGGGGVGASWLACVYNTGYCAIGAKIQMDERCLTPEGHYPFRTIAHYLNEEHARLKFPRKNHPPTTVR